MLLYYNIVLNKNYDSNESDESNSSSESDKIYIETNDKFGGMNSLPLFYFNKKYKYNNDNKKDSLIKKK